MEDTTNTTNDLSAGMDKNEKKPTATTRKRNAYTVLPMTAGNAETFGDKNETDNDQSFGDALYDAINEALGGDSANQFLCLTLPGQSLTASDYAYNYAQKEPKGPTVEANESRLANKMFDACRVASGDNGLTLPYQYRSALDMLSPKLNAKIAQAKNSLRELLMTPYPYDFGDGDDKNHTLQEVYFRLYDEWVEEQKNWAKAQSDAKDKHGDGTDKYLEWYETEADSYISAVDEKMSKVISVFTPNDMKILEGILDSGSGAELQEARQMLLDTRKRSPDGGYIYPVKFYPTNWFELLETSFTPADLLKDPEALAEKMRLLSSRRLELNAQIEDIAKLIPSNADLTKLKSAADEAGNAVRKEQQALIDKYGTGITTVFSAVLDIASLFDKGKAPNSIVKKLTRKNVSGDVNIDEVVEKLVDSATKTFEKQTEYVALSQELAQKSEALIKAQALSGLSEMLSPLKTKLAEINDEIEDLKTQIHISSAHRVSDEEKDNATGETAVASNAVPAGYTRVYVSKKATSLTQGSSSQSSASQKANGVSFFFGGYSSQNDSKSAAFSSFAGNRDTEIDVGMNVAKVGIEREWFNPGVFALTKDMVKLTATNISPTEQYSSVDDDRIKKMASEGYVFPCYPIAMLIARDISIRFKFSSEVDTSFSEAVESHSSSGGGFLFFSGSKSSSSSSKTSCVNMQSNAKSITLRFDTPQVIGYFLECTFADKSVCLDNIDKQNDDFVTISQFVDSYKKVLEARADRYNQEKKKEKEKD